MNWRNEKYTNHNYRTEETVKILLKKTDNIIHFNTATEIMTKLNPVGFGNFNRERIKVFMVLNSAE